MKPGHGIVLLAVACCAEIAMAEMSRGCDDNGTESSVQVPSIKIASLNIAHGRKKAINQMFVSRKRTYRNLDDIAALLQRIDADIVALQEADAPSKWSGKFDHVEHLIEQSDYTCFVHGRQAKNWLYAFGTALLSKIELNDEYSLSFDPSPPTTTKGFVFSTIDWEFANTTMPLTVVSVHLDFLRKKTRDAQINAMITSLSGLETPIIIAGDFNSDWFSKDSSVKALADALDLLVYNPDQSGLGTYKSSSGKRLDWILISRQLEFLEYAVLPDVVSDHSAVYAEIGYRGE